MDSVTSILLDSAIFEDISPEAVEELSSHARVVSFEAGRTLFERDQQADELLILLEGVVQLVFPVEVIGVTRDVTMERAEPGDVLAWSSLVSPHRFTLSAECTTRCVMRGLSRNSLQASFQTDPQTGYLFMRNLAGVIGRRLQAMQTMWMHELQSTASRRME